MHLKQNKIPLKTIKEATQLTKVLLIRIASVLKHTRFFDILCVLGWHVVHIPSLLYLWLSLQLPKHIQVR